MGFRSVRALLSVSVALGFILSCATQASDTPSGGSGGDGDTPGSGGAGGKVSASGSGGMNGGGASAVVAGQGGGGSGGSGGLGTAGAAGTGLAGAGGTAGASGNAGTSGGSGSAATAGIGGSGGAVAGSGGAGAGGAGSAGAGGNAGVVGNTYTLNHFVIGSSAASATVHVTWSATQLELVFDVQDATPFDDSMVNWQDDAGEIYLDLNDSKGGTFDGDDCEIVIPRVTGIVDGVGLSTVQFAAISVQRTSVGATGYTLDVSIPWTSLNVATPPLGQTIGINLAVDDDTNGGDRDAQLLLSGDQFAYDEPSAWASLLLD